MGTKLSQDTAVLEQRIKAILTDIQEREDPVELDAYRAFFRKHVPLFRRSYFAAYLLKNLQGSPRLSSLSSTSALSRPARAERPGRQPASSSGSPSASLPGSSADSGSSTRSTRTDLVTIFIGIGKSRKVYPKDLVGLILDTTSTRKEDIGNINIKDNYSFVEVAPEIADTIINSLNGMTFRGRSLNVNYARKKD